MISSLYYSIKLQGSPLSIYEFFNNLHATKFLHSIGRVSFDAVTNTNTSNSQGLSSTNPNQFVDLSFTLKIAVNSSASQSLDDISDIYVAPGSPDDLDQFTDNTSSFDDFPESNSILDFDSMQPHRSSTCRRL